MISKKNGDFLLRFRGQILCRPLLVFFQSVDVEPSLHTGVTKAAELGARKLVFARLRSFKPNQNRSARDGILSEPQIRQVKTVNHVPSREITTHSSIHTATQT